MAGERTITSEVDMEREIKFRLFWDGKFIYWGFFDDGDGLTFASPSFGGGLSIKEALKRSQQFTGRKDKNGVEGYHYDIVRDDCHGLGLIEWNESQAGFILHFDCGGSHIYTNLALSKRVIVGNIHENLKLLEGNDGT